MPSIIAAQQLRADAQRMDADLADAVLVNGNQALSQQDWVKRRSDDAKLVVNEIATAQGNVAFAGECEALAALRDGLVDFSTFAAQTERAVAAADATSSPDAVPLYNRADDVLVRRIEPALVAGNPGDATVVQRGADPAPLTAAGQ